MTGPARLVPAVQHLAALLLLGGLALVWWLPAREAPLGGYATSLEGRTPGQRHNALRAAQALDGLTLPPGGVLSFNRHVGAWSPDRGFVRAPVSYDGELVVDWGGGVCQTSSTLYNAALLAGLEILERHRHTWAPTYVPVGRDAAVAHATLDLRLRNPYPTPVRLRLRGDATHLGFIWLGTLAGPMARLSIQAHSPVAPVALSGAVHSSAVPQHGRPGARVTVTRRFLRGPRAGTLELVSRDTYPPLHGIRSSP
jgi:vancomycin resistance protein VanW